jgi:hypothetical protein
MHILYRLFDPLLTTDTNDWTYTLLDTPRCSYTCHANIILLRDFLDPLDDLLVSREFALVHECGDKFVGFGALGGSIGKGTCEGAPRNWGPRNEADASILTVRDLSGLNGCKGYERRRE